MTSASHPPRPLRVGLTGGIGSGKSTVAARLQACGAALVDTDALARRVTGPAGEAMAEVLAVFGSHMADARGALDRDRMRSLVFTDPHARGRLEAVVHPWVARLAARETQAAEQAGARVVVYDVPLLVESGRWRRQVDRVLVVDCEAATQVDRVMRRSGLAEAAVHAIMKAQASRTDRLAAADWVLFNDGLSLADLQAEVDRLALSFGLSLPPEAEPS